MPAGSEVDLRIVELDAERAKRQSVGDKIIRQMYELLGSNMTQVIPTSGSDWRSDAAFAKWRKDVFERNLSEGTRHLLLFDQRGLRGFVSYTAPPGAKEIYLNEFQIQPYAQCDGVTFKRLLFHFMNQINELPHASVRTYTNKHNGRAQRLIEKVGFQRGTQTRRGIRYTVRKDALCDKLCGLGKRKGRAGGCKRSVKPRA